MDTWIVYVPAVINRRRLWQPVLALPRLAECSWSDLIAVSIAGRRLSDDMLRLTSFVLSEIAA